MNALDPLMETASSALARTDYVTCEVLCLQALAKARETQDWDTYLHILRPLQEARRWRRQEMEDAAARHLKSAAPAFIATAERLGDALLAACASPPGSVARVDEIQAQLNILPEHEKLHQALAAAVKAVMRP